MIDIPNSLQNHKKRHHVAGLGVSVLISVAILFLIVKIQKIDFSAIAREWEKADKALLVCIIVLSALFHIFVGAHKLWMVLRTMGVDISFREMILIRLGGGPLRVILPFKTGELVNIVFFWRHKNMRFGQSSGAIVFDKGLNFIGIIFWFLVGISFMLGETPAKQILFAIGSGGAYLFFFFCTPIHDSIVRLVSHVPKVGGFTAGVLSPFREFPVHRKVFFLAYGLFFQLRPLVVCYFLFRVYDVGARAVHVLIYTSFAILSGHIPGPIAGLGPREVVIVKLFKDYAADDILFSVGLLLTFSVHLIPMFLGIPFVPWFLYRLKNGSGQ